MKIYNKNTLAANWYEELSVNNVINSYFGPLDFRITSEIINHFGDTLKRKNIKRKVFKKIYSSFAEGVENAYKYQLESDLDKPGMIFCSLVGESVEITIGNTISLDQKIQLTNYIEQLINEDLVLLKKSIKTDLLNLSLNGKEKSAHIGLKRIVINSEKDLKYSFKELHNGELFFMLNFRIKSN